MCDAGWTTWYLPEKGFLGPDILHARMRAPHNRSVGESPATAGTPKAQAPPGNAQAHERQIAGALESGERRWRSPTEGERRGTRPISQVTGQRAAGRSTPAVLNWSPERL